MTSNKQVELHILNLSSSRYIQSIGWTGSAEINARKVRNGVLRRIHAAVQHILTP
jgi:hypothetical protein